MSKRRAPANTFWRGDVLWGRIKVKGTLHRWSLRTGNPVLATNRVREFKEQEIARAHYGDARRTYTETVRAWGKEMAPKLQPKTMTRYLVSLKQLLPHLSESYLDEINHAMIADIITHRRNRGVTTATIRRDLVALSSVMGFAIDLGWRQDNPVLPRLKRLKEKRDPIALPDPDHIAMVVKRLPGNLKGLTMAALKTGCRQDELVGAERSNLDYARKQLTVTGKGNKLRTLELSDAALAVFKALPVFTGCKWLFWHGDGEPYRNVSSRFAHLVKETQKEAQRDEREFRPFTFHHLRHRYAVDYLKAGGNIYDLQQLLGHSSVKTTEIYLTYLTPAEQRAVKFGSSAVTQKESQEQRSGVA
jgi:integrase/recombinase XerD